MPAVGIDLGTTNSVVAVVDAGGKARVLRGDGETSPIVPSVVWFADDGRVVVGNEAKEQQATDSTGVASFFKRQMGDANARFVARGREYTPIELSAEVLKRLKRDAEFALRGPVRDAVVTVPAYFYDQERKATHEAARLAGLNVLQLINEPTAAAVAFGAGALTPQGGHVLVYDLGGGTFDVTLLRMETQGISVITSDGDAQLGGKDWDHRVVNFLAGKFRDEFGADLFAERAATGDLWLASERAKKELSARQSSRLRISCSGQTLEYELTRPFFDSLCADLTARTIDMVKAVLDRAKLRPNQLEMVLLVGGSTRMPMVQQALEQLTGKKPSGGVNPDEAVALGAALCAAGHQSQTQPGYSLAAGKKAAAHTFTLPSGKAVTDVAPHSLGMIATKPDLSAYINDVILAKDQPIPRADRKSYRFATSPHGGNLMEIFLTQGEQSSPRHVKYLGRYVVADVPHDPSGAATIEVTYSYNRSGSIDVAAATAAGQSLAVRVEPLPADVPDRFLQPPPKPPPPKPITIYLSFDLSGSMSGAPLADAQRSAIECFVNKLDLERAAIGVIIHADEAKIKLHATHRGADVRRAIQSLRIGEVGGGNDQHPFDEAMRALRGAEGLRFVVALADGVWSDQEEAVVSAKRLHQAGVEVIALGFGGADEAFLRRIASCDEGGIFTSQSGLGEAFSTIASVISESSGGAAASSGSPSKAPGLLASLFRRK